MMYKKILFLLFFFLPLFAERPFFIVTIPKAGSHLLISTLSALTGKKSTAPSAKLSVMEHTPLVNKYSKTDFLLEKVSEETLEKFILLAYKKNRYCFVHMGLAEDFISFQKKNPEFIPITIIRDPRDTIVSAAYYFAEYIDIAHKTSTLEERILVLLNQYQEKSYIPLRKEKYNGYTHHLEMLAWKNFFKEKGLIIRFEDLVGPHGGGSSTLQMHTLKTLIEKLELDAPLQTDPDFIFGKEKTFRKGKIGEWKTHFNEEHQQIYKEYWLHIHEALGYPY